MRGADGPAGPGRVAAAMGRSPHHRLSAKARRRVFGVVRGLLGLAVLAYIFSLVHVEAFRPLLQRENVLWAFMALGFLCANVFVAAWRWQTLLYILGVRERIAPLL